GLLEIGLGLNLGDLLNIDLGLDLLKCKKLLELASKVNSLKAQEENHLVDANVNIDV
ncbi:hypothetical protein L0F63_003173, partial [Massospora cicadina]